MMNKRIKTVYLLSILGIVSFCALQGFWLFRQYESYIDGRAVTMYTELVSVADDALSKLASKKAVGKNTFYRSRHEMHGDAILYSGMIMTISDKVGYAEAVDIVDSLEAGIRSDKVVACYSYDKVDVTNISSKAFQDAELRLRLFSQVPFRTDSFAIGMERRLGTKCRAEVVKETPNRVWNAKLFLPDRLFHPQVEVLYPYNPLMGGAVKIIADVPIDKVLKEMAATLAVTLTVAIVLVFCLVLQVKTIRRQQRVAEFQKNYTLTMLHELKRPVSALKMFVSFMRNPRLTDDDRMQALANGEKEIGNLAAYFDKLRTLTYAEASELPVSLATFDLADVARECAHRSAGKVIVMSDDECLITADRRGIANVMANLIENAEKYAPGNAPIEVEWEKSASDIRISIADRGRGIPDADKSRIYERFYRAQADAAVPGLGLGLAYVKQVVDAHGGSIEAKDRPGGGTIFTIKIPQ